MYRKFRDDPSSVDPSWHEFLVDYSPEPTGNGAADRAVGHPDSTTETGRDHRNAGGRACSTAR